MQRPCTPTACSVAALLALAALLLPAGTTDAQPLGGDADDGNVRWSAAFDPAEAAPGDTVTLTVTARIRRGWHIYTFDAGEFGVATELRLIGEGLEPAGEWSEPESHPDGNGTMVIEGTAAFQRRYTVPASAAAGELELTVRAAWQACDDMICLPPADLLLPVELVVAAADGTDPTVAELRAEIERLRGELAATRDAMAGLQRQMRELDAVIQQRVEAALDELRERERQERFQRQLAERLEYIDRVASRLPDMIARMVDSLAERGMLPADRTGDVLNVMLEDHERRTALMQEAAEGSWTIERLTGVMEECEAEVQKSLSEFGLDDDQISALRRFSGALWQIVERNR